MAEIRKHSERAEGLAAAVRAAIGEDVRPVAPGDPTPGPDETAAPSTNITLSMPFLTKGAESFLLPQQVVSVSADEPSSTEDDRTKN